MDKIQIVAQWIGLAFTAYVVVLILKILLVPLLQTISITLVSLAACIIHRRPIQKTEWRTFPEKVLDLYRMFWHDSGAVKITITTDLFCWKGIFCFKINPVKRPKGK